MIKQVIVDLDGTLLTDDKRVSPKTLASIRKYHEKGTKFTICTGRSLIEVTHISEIQGVFKVCDYVITSNGGSIASLKDFKRLHSYNIDKSKIKEIYNIVKDKDMMFEVFVDGKVYSEQKPLSHYRDYINIAFHTMVEETRIPVLDIMDFVKNVNGDIPMLFISFRDQTTRDDAFKVISRIEGITAHLSWTQAIEIGLEGVDKGQSVIKLAQLTNISKDEVMCIGDSYNDLPMRNATNTLIAMGNAITPLKDIADFITKSNEEDGVVYALDKFLK